jgi:hypothetical protein
MRKESTICDRKQLHVKLPLMLACAQLIGHFVTKCLYAWIKGANSHSFLNVLGLMAARGAKGNACATADTGMIVLPLKHGMKKCFPFYVSS